MAKIHDLIGIGFGPSNLALAIAIEEQCGNAGFAALFLEQKRAFGWHPGMLLPGMEMQISFLKDLVTQRNPTSRYTFLSYLKDKGRLSEFANLRHFYPSRVEFNDYLAWVADKLGHCVRYGRRVVSVTPHGAAPHELLEVVAEDVATGATQRLLARNLVVATGGTPQIPFELSSAPNSERVWHSSQHLEKLQALRTAKVEPRHIVVVGRGQSAAEIVHDLHARFPQASITCIFRGFGLKPADDSEFVNELFDAGLVDFLQDTAPALRQGLLRDHRNTNYSVVDSELIRVLYRMRYAERVSGACRLRFRNLCSVKSIAETAGGLTIAVSTATSNDVDVITADMAVLATGYTYPNPPRLLQSLAPYLLAGEQGAAVVSRHYRLATDARLGAGIYTQGCNESTHGLSDTLLSVLASRSEEILHDMLAKMTQRSCSAPDAACSMVVAS